MRALTFLNSILTTILIVVSIGISSSQVSISGTVTEAHGVPIPFANIILQSPLDSTSFQGAITDESGSYELKGIRPNKYTLTISSIGFEPRIIDLSLHQDITLKPAILSESIQELDHVTITAKRKLVQQKVDRLIVDISNSLRSGIGDALEVLKVTPGVNVVNDQIRMIGKSGVRVLINDKPINLSASDLSNYLKSIPSEDIRNIEVITAPPAKYDASGNSGIININIIRPEVDSWNASIRSAYWQRTYATGSAGANFNYNQNRLSLAFSAFHHKSKYYQEQDDYAHFPDGVWYTSSPFTSDLNGVNGRMDLTYTISDTWSIGGQYAYNNLIYDYKDAPITQVFDHQTDEILQQLTSQGKIDLNPTTQSANINSHIKLDTLGRKISLNLDYFAFANADAKSYDGVSAIQGISTRTYFKGTNTNSQMVNNYSGKIDLSYPTTAGDWEVGIKVTSTMSNNDIAFFNSGLTDLPVGDTPLSSNDFEYTENVQSGYLSYSTSLSDKIQLKTGLRVERTATHSLSTLLSLNEERQYIKLFPTVYVSYQMNDQSSFSMNYSRRISRPQFFDLNPNPYFINPFQSIRGNAFLTPSFTDNIELNFKHGDLISKIYYSKEEGQFGQVPLANSTNNEIIFINLNYIKSSGFGLSEQYNFNKIDWWDLSASINVGYIKYQFILDKPQPDQSGLSSRFSMNNDLRLSPKNDLFLSLGFWYKFAGVDQIYATKPASALSIALKFTTLRGKLSVNLRANDILKASADRNSSIINGVLQTARYYYDTRSLFLSLGYTFGNPNIKASRHNAGNQEERDRTG